MKKQLVIRRQKIIVKVANGPYKNRKAALLKRGMSGWHCRFKDTCEKGYLFNHEIQ